MKEAITTQMRGTRWVIDPNTGEYFLIRNRDFSENDHRFRGLISKLIPQMVELNSTGRVDILDIGGGEESKSSSELAKKFLTKVTVTNLDLIARAEDETVNFRPVRGSMFDIPYPSNTFDIVYSRQVLTYYVDEFKDPNLDPALIEIMRVLKPGGVAILDEDYYTTEHYSSDEEKRQLPDRLGAKIRVMQGGIFINPFERIDRLINPSYFYPGVFMLAQKLPVNPHIDSLLENVPQELPRWTTK